MSARSSDSSANEPGVLVSFDPPAAQTDVDSSRIRHLVEHILVSEKIVWSQIGIIFTGHDRLRSLHRDFLGNDFNTDVLSFLLEDTDDGIEGEVYVDVETAAERYEEFATTVGGEIERYVAHGILHLAGYLDDSREGKQQMGKLESEYLASL